MDFKGGSVQVSNDVIDVIIASTALKVEGVEAVKGYDGKKLKRSHDKNIVTSVAGKVLRTSITIRVDKERPIVSVVQEVQANIKKQIESMLGLQCEAVDVLVI